MKAVIAENGLESQVDPAQFFRVNRQYLISMEAIIRFRPGGKGIIDRRVRYPTHRADTVSQGRDCEFRQWIGR